MTLLNRTSTELYQVSETRDEPTLFTAVTSQRKSGLTGVTSQRESSQSAGVTSYHTVTGNATYNVTGTDVSSTISYQNSDTRELQKEGISKFNYTNGLNFTTNSVITDGVLQSDVTNGILNGINVTYGKPYTSVTSKVTFGVPDFNVTYNIPGFNVTYGVLEPRQEYKWYYTGLLVIPLWILFGNLMVLLAVRRQRNLRTLSNLVIASLAVTDFLLSLCVVPLNAYQLVSIVVIGNSVTLKSGLIFHLQIIIIIIIMH